VGGELRYKNQTVDVSTRIALSLNYARSSRHRYTCTRPLLQGLGKQQGSLVTEAGCRWFQDEASSSGSPLEMVNWVQVGDSPNAEPSILCFVFVLL
jgi:hypothetical protein